MSANSSKSLLLGLSSLAVGAVLLGACASSPPPQPVATVPPPAPAFVAIAPQAGTPATVPGTVTTTTTTYGSLVTAPSPPPAPRAEIIPPSPGPQMVWEPGYWSFNGGSWLWIPGHYEARPQPAAQWIPGHWMQQSDGAWVWIAGFWTS